MGKKKKRPHPRKGRKKLEKNWFVLRKKAAPKKRSEGLGGLLSRQRNAISSRGRKSQERRPTKKPSFGKKNRRNEHLWKREKIGWEIVIFRGEV